LFIGFVTTGVPLGVTFSFLVSAPMVNEVALVLLFGLFGWKVAGLYLTTGLFIAILSGWVIGKLRMERHVEDWVFQTQTGPGAGDQELDWPARVCFGRDAVQDIVGRVWFYVLLGIGVGVPGPVDFSHAVLVAPPLMPDWENFPIRDFIQRTFPTAYVVVDNDVNIMALGEQRAGDGSGVDHFIFIKIGTGIGAGIVSNGKIHRGSIGCAGDIGHICVDKQGAVCRCGNTGCLEAMAAGPAISEKAMQAAKNGLSPLLLQMLESNGGYLRPEDVNAACREGDQAALEIIRSSGQMVGDVLAGLVNFFNPSHIFIGGGITNFGNHLLVAIRRAVLRRSLPLATRNLSINYSRMGPEAGVTGAVALAREYLFVIEDQPFLTV